LAKIRLINTHDVCATPTAVSLVLLNYGLNRKLNRVTKLNHNFSRCMYLSHQNIK